MQSRIGSGPRARRAAAAHPLGADVETFVGDAGGIISALRLVLDRFYDLSQPEQFQVFKAISDFLGKPIVAGSFAEVAERRHEALDAIGKVARALGLPEGKAPTVDQFDEEARRLGLQWDRSRVIRAWGMWRVAVAAWKGDYVRHSAAQRDLIRTGHRQRLKTEDPVRAVKRWLRTNPASRTKRSYEGWADEENRKLPAGEVPVPRAINATHTGLRWAALVAHAAGEITLDAARAESAAEAKRHRPGSEAYELVSLGELARMLGITTSAAAKRTRRQFPPPVYETPRVRAWLRSDIEKLVAGKPLPERRHNELRGQYLGTTEVASRFGISASSVSERADVPPPSLIVGGVRLWRVDEVEEALRAPKPERLTRANRLERMRKDRA